ncbi:MAG: methionine biosynthesis protein MetW [Patescibacteria group bacterium]
MENKIFEDNRWQVKDQHLNFGHKAILSFIDRGWVLDVGCGDGLLLSALKDRGIDGLGLDFSEEAIKKCKARGVRAQLTDLTKTPWLVEEKGFDYVVALDVLEHFYYPEKLLAEMKRISSGYLIIGVPNFNSLAARLQVLLGKVPENNTLKKGHVFWFNWHLFQEMISRNNLEIIETKTSSFRYPGFKILAKLFPSVFALSFVVKVKKISF